MLKRLAFAVLAVAVLGGFARAQEAEDEEIAKAPVRKIKVLENPYDLASFYRSSQGEYFGGEQAADSRYPIASFYRSRQTNAYGYAPFWSNGYGSGYRRGGATVRYRRRIGENGDLFLFAPTFLAPVGPLNGAFFGN